MPRREGKDAGREVKNEKRILDEKIKIEKNIKKRR